MHFSFEEVDLSDEMNATNHESLLHLLSKDKDLSRLSLIQLESVINQEHNLGSYNIVFNTQQNIIFKENYLVSKSERIVMSMVMERALKAT